MVKIRVRGINHIMDQTSSRFIVAFYCIVSILSPLSQCTLQTDIACGYSISPYSSNPLLGTNSFPPFPNNFGFGVATSAFQIEGAWNDSRSPSVWDFYCHHGYCNHQVADVTDDHYHRVEEDIDLMVNTSIRFYRLSISWSRMFLTLDGPVNTIAIKHYRRELKMLVEKGIVPFVTLSHWDLPLYLNDNDTAKNDGRGWSTEVTRHAFVRYARACFHAFGDLVTYWATFNEPFVMAADYYGPSAPGCSAFRYLNNGSCELPSVRNTFKVAHNILLSHALVVDTYRNEFKEKQGGSIGIVLNGDWVEPCSNISIENSNAAERWLQFQFGWFFDPIFFGDYPEIMKANVPYLKEFSFNETEKILLRGSHDFFGLNQYTSRFVKSGSPSGSKGWYSLVNVTEDTLCPGPPSRSIGPLQSASPWLYSHPAGLRKLLVWLDRRYNHVPIWITENGLDRKGENEMSLKDAVNDTARIGYLHGYISAVSDAIMIDKVDVRGYFVWSLLDNFEWASGTALRYGLYYVNYTTLVRTPKLIASNPKFNGEFSFIFCGIPIIVGSISTVIVLVWWYIEYNSRSKEYTPIDESPNSSIDITIDDDDDDDNGSE